MFVKSLDYELNEDYSWENANNIISIFTIIEKINLSNINNKKIKDDNIKSNETKTEKLVIFQKYIVW